MNFRADGLVGQRSYRARAGATALNLITPGLGLLRVGSWRSGVLLLLASFALLALVALGLGHFPINSYGRAVLALVIVLALLAALYVSSAALTWRESRFRSPVQWWSSWYGLTTIAVTVLILMQLAQALALSFVKPFYAPSESMAPTISRGDKFIADMRWRGPLKRGEIIIFHGLDSVRISRVAAVAEDRIAMRGGVPIVNGNAASQSVDGPPTFRSFNGSPSAVTLKERLPGEASTHRILEIGPSEFDDMKEVVVPAGHFFVLGDNRDRSADSRVPLDLAGAGMVPLTAIIGRPMYIHWSSDRARIGTRLDR